MLNGIKDLINSKIAMQESASIIVEGNTGMDLDDLIVLGEEGLNDTGEELPEDGNEPDEEDPEDNNDEPKTAENDLEDPIEDDDDEDLLSQDVNGGTTTTGSDDMNLPTPIGRQTGEPVLDDPDDLLRMEIDLKSNTPSDILPVPPANSTEVVQDEEDDLLGQSISVDNPTPEGDPINNNPVLPDGLPGNDSAISAVESVNSSDDFTKRFIANIFAESADESKRMTEALKSVMINFNNYIKENANASSVQWSVISKGINLDGIDVPKLQKMFSEAISMGDDGDPAPEGDSSEAPDAGLEDPGASPDGENPVTSAVRDKVNEADTGDDSGSGSTDDIGSSSSDTDKDIYKKISSLTKSLEDVKNQIVDKLSNQ